MKSIFDLFEPFGYRTLYNGVLYASELEAFWAALFDNIRQKFAYEPLGNRSFPHFYFPDIDVYGEVKPEQGIGGNCWKDPKVMQDWIHSHSHYNKWREFAAQRRLVIFAGLIGNLPIYQIDPDGTCKLSDDFVKMNKDEFRVGQEVAMAKRTIWDLKNSSRGI